MTTQLQLINIIILLLFNSDCVQSDGFVGDLERIQ